MGMLGKVALSTGSSEMQFQCFLRVTLIFFVESEYVVRNVSGRVLHVVAVGALFGLMSAIVFEISSFG